MINFITGFLLGLSISYIIYSFTRAAPIRTWHQIGYTMQHMHRVNLKTMNKEELEANISEN